MATTALDKLMFQIGLIDQVSGPVRKIDKVIGGMKQNAMSGFQSIQSGAIGLAASGIAIASMLKPAIELDRALGEVKSLGVIDKELKALTSSALKFSMQYGESATDFVRSSYDIQSSIAGLTNGELAKFTTASNLLAKATKADASTITDYMGTMYGIFDTQATAMGKAQWVQQLTGQTAMAVQMFKTDGSKMGMAFSRLGGDATAHGVAMNEQMAVLGQLSATMGGGEAATKYKSFLSGVGQAQDHLGLKFTDSNNRLLPMVDILQKLKGKFGDVIDVSEVMDLKKAFGSDQAVSMLSLLMKNTDSLAGNIDKLGKVTGMDKAKQMAMAMVDPFQQFGSSVNAVRIAFGTALLPVITPVLNALSEGASTLTRWTQLFPNLTRAVGMGVLGILGLSAAVSAFVLVAGLAKLAMVGWAGVMLVANGAVWALKFSLIALRVAAIAGLVVSIVSAVAAFGLVKGAMLAWQGVIWLTNAALWANPIVWVVAGIIALIAAVAAVVYYWDDLKAAFLDSAWGQSIIGVLNAVIAPFTGLFSMWDLMQSSWDGMRASLGESTWGMAIIAVIDTITLPFRTLLGLWDTVLSGWGVLTAAFTDGGWSQVFSTIIDAVMGAFSAVGDGVAWIIDKMNMIPGINIGVNADPLPDYGQYAANNAYSNTAQTMPQLQSLQSSQQANVPAGGIMQQIQNRQTNNGGTSYGDVHISNQQPMTPDVMNEWMAVEGG